MHTTPMLAQTLSDQSVSLADPSVRSIWVQFMSWVIGGIGLGYLARDAAGRLPVLLAAFIPERQLRSSEPHGATLHLPVSSQLNLTS